MYALDSNEILRVSKCVSAKDTWDTLERTHKDSSGNDWLDNDMSSSKVSKTNMCLMAKEKSTSNRNGQHSNDDSEEENLILLSKKFTKFLKKNNNKNHTNDRYVSQKPT